MPANRRRRKYIDVQERELFDWFLLHTRNLPHYLLIYKLEGMPEDVEIINIHYMMETLSFRFTLCHDSFPEVPQGEPTPMYDGTARWEWSPPKKSPEKFDQQIPGG